MMNDITYNARFVQVCIPPRPHPVNRVSFCLHQRMRKSIGLLFESIDLSRHQDYFICHIIETKNAIESR